MRRLFLLCGVLCACQSRAAQPALTHMHPAGMQVGTTASVQLTGKFEPWPCNVWTDSPGIVFAPAKDARTFDVTVAADVKPGPHLIRAFNDDGASAPISMVVDRVPQILEVEPNDDFRAPQKLTGSTGTINGKLGKSGDVDSFLVALKKGQTMVSWVEAYVLAAGFDAMLRVVDSNGTTLAFNHDHTTIDPFLVFIAPHDGDYIVQTMGQKYPASTDIHFAGGEDCVYRLHVSTEPFVRNTWPLAVQRGKKSTVMLEGWNLAAPRAEIDDTAPPQFPVTFSDVPELTETAEPQTLPIPSGVSGRIIGVAHEDRYNFTATKGVALDLSVTGPTLGSAIDARLRVLNPEGKELATNDDSGGASEPRLLWTASTDGTYTAAVSDLTQRGGDLFFYRLQITDANTPATATIASHSAKLEAGKTAELKVAVSLPKPFPFKLRLSANNLPEGVTAPEVDVPEKGGEVAITLTAAPAAPRSSQPFTLTLREVEGGKQYPVLFKMISTSEDNGVPQGYRKLLINSTDQLWLTLAAPPPAAPADPAAK
jgi:hypothetical protein